MSHSRTNGRSITVAVTPPEGLAARPRLFAMLEAAFPVSFHPEGAAPADAHLVLCDGAIPAASQLARSGAPVLAACAQQDQLGQPGPGTSVAFEDDPYVDRRIRSAAVADPLDAPKLDRIAAHERVLAAAVDGPVWTFASDGGGVHRLRTALPEQPQDAVLRTAIARRPIALIALTQFLRDLTSSKAFEPPPPRAVFLFDDPNLRWRTYGFIDYERLAEHADEHGYHASMAMIPFDGWRHHGATADLFRSRPDRLSLVYHGNNHVSRELMRIQDDHRALSLAAQAMRRVARFEARAGLPVGRVMTPPHGMCSESAARALGAVGFDALCAAHAIPWQEGLPASRPLCGWEPGEFADECAVITRVPFTESETELAVRSFLGQPLILYGHHNDLAQGLDVLAEVADRVNRCPGTRWSSLGAIAAGNFSRRIEDSAMRIRPYSRRLLVDVPAGVRQLIVERPRNTNGELVGWSDSDGEPFAFDLPIGCEGSTVEIRLRGVEEIDPAQVPSPRWQPWPILRRTATEARDRLLAMRPLTAQVLALATTLEQLA